MMNKTLIFESSQPDIRIVIDVGFFVVVARTERASTGAIIERGTLTAKAYRDYQLADISDDLIGWDEPFKLFRQKWLNQLRAWHFSVAQVDLLREEMDELATFWDRTLFEPA